MHAALVEQARGPGPSLVFCEGLDTIQTDQTHRAERDLAAKAAGVLGLPLVLITTNLPQLTNPLVDWADMHGGALGFVALSLAGGLRAVTVGSTHAPNTVGPWGSSPYLDPLWSTEAVDVVHGPLATRPAKLALIAQRAPELLGLIKVCFQEDRPDNRGRCGKCLLTLVCLEGLGLRDRASSFPPTLDARLIPDLRPGNLSARLLWLDGYRSLSQDRRHRQLRRAIERMLRRTARPGPLERLRRRELQRPPQSGERGNFGRHRSNLARSLLIKGEPYP